jgi:hypothetical protein
MFQQSIPRLLPDSDIATYHWPFILIDDQTDQFWSKAVINFNGFFEILLSNHVGFLEGVYEIELDTKTE